MARRLRWNEYAKLINKPIIHFDQTFCFEELEEGHQKFVEQFLRTITPMTLRYTHPDASIIPASQIPKGKPKWLVVHSFIHEEVESLITY